MERAQTGKYLSIPSTQPWKILLSRAPPASLMLKKCHTGSQETGFQGAWGRPSITRWTHSLGTELRHRCDPWFPCHYNSPSLNNIPFPSTPPHLFHMKCHWPNPQKTNVQRDRDVQIRTPFLDLRLINLFCLFNELLCWAVRSASHTTHGTLQFSNIPWHSQAR